MIVCISLALICQQRAFWVWVNSYFKSRKIFVFVKYDWFSGGQISWKLGKRWAYLGQFSGSSLVISEDEGDEYLLDFPLGRNPTEVGEVDAIQGIVRNEVTTPLVLIRVHAGHHRFTTPTGNNYTLLTTMMTNLQVLEEENNNWRKLWWGDSLCRSNAPINVIPHYHRYGLRWGKVGICIPVNYNSPPTGEVLAIQTSVETGSLLLIRWPGCDLD